MNTAPYFGNAPYCYTNTLLTALGRPDLPTGLLETLTGSPFGFQLLFGQLPLFDPLGWSPDLGLDQALSLLGYTWETHALTDEDQALAALHTELEHGPVFIGPLDMGLLGHQPGSDRATGADHFVTALEISEGLVHLHDPQGHPWAALPTPLFMQAWRAEQIGYAEPFTLRKNFQQEQQTTPTEALRQLMPLAAQWLAGRDTLPVPPGTLGGQVGLERLAEQVEQELTEELRGTLIQFSIRVGARRKADAAQVFAQIGHDQAAHLLHRQARTLGALQYPAILRDQQALAQGFRMLGTLHQDLSQVLA